MNEICIPYRLKKERKKEKSIDEKKERKIDRRKKRKESAIIESWIEGEKSSGILDYLCRRIELE